MIDKAKRCANLIARDFPEGGLWTTEEINRIISHPGGHLFENEGGFLIAKSVADEAEIWTLVVAHEKRRQGHARDLVITCAKRLRDDGIRNLFLEVAQDNHDAFALYQSCGFLEISRRRDYYRRANGQAQDAIVMRLSLF